MWLYYVQSWWKKNQEKEAREEKESREKKESRKKKAGKKKESRKKECLEVGGGEQKAKGGLLKKQEKKP